jgi:DNA-binding transcriptional LysR family regulator
VKQCHSDPIYPPEAEIWPLPAMCASQVLLDDISLSQRGGAGPRGSLMTSLADLDGILIFVKVAQFGSISRAARSLGMPISTVSRRLSVLESKLGVSLLRRTTRRITLTAQGREYFSQCREPLTLLEEAERVLTLGQNTPEGMLRISVPVILGQAPFMDFLSEFLRAQASRSVHHESLSRSDCGKH